MVSKFAIKMRNALGKRWHSRRDETPGRAAHNRWIAIGDDLPIGYEWKVYKNSIAFDADIVPVPVTDEMLAPGEITVGFNSDGARAIVLAAAYVFAKISREQSSISVLDFGGAAGGYYRIARNAIPEVKIDYTVQELPELCRFGSRARPDVRFVSDKDSLSAGYDLVFASGAIQYIRDWRKQFDLLATRADPWLFVTRVMSLRHTSKIIEQTIDGSVISVWAIGQEDLLEEARRHDMKLVDIFDLQSEFEPIVGLNESPVVKGYLFRRENI